MCPVYPCDEVPHTSKYDQPTYSQNLKEHNGLKIIYYISSEITKTIFSQCQSCFLIMYRETSISMIDT